jgi:protein-disulfide isomerase
MTSSIIRVILLVLGLLLLPLPAGTPARAEDTITREQADTLIKEIRELRQAIDRLRAPRSAERPADEKVRVPLTAPKVLGQANAPVTLVEFTDLECPFCRSFHVGTFDKIKQTYIDTGRWLRHLRLPAGHASQRPCGRGGGPLRRRAGKVLGDAAPGDRQRRHAEP